MFFVPKNVELKVRSSVIITCVAPVTMVLLAAFIVHWLLVAIPLAPGVNSVCPFAGLL